MVHVRELTADRAHLALRHHAVYKAMWQDVEAKICASNRAGVSQLQYKLSPLHIIMHGQPLVSSQRAARYIRDKLARNGFAVAVSDLGAVGVILDICWHDQAIDMRAALAAAEAPSLGHKPQQQQQRPIGGSDDDMLLGQLANQRRS